MQRTLDSLSIRGSVNFLEGTKYEALNINEQLLQNNVDTTYVLMGDEGIEETFKQLNGTSRSIIHIATHGFSFSEQEIKEKGDKLVFINEQNDNLDNMLNYSGLLMSGANYVLKGRKLPEDIEDGILTAREISQVDLGKVGLVVLSACQTALGEIREDGVFGIQRGFKKAGAHSLLMSLWKVDDRATEIMMTAFYRNLVKSNDRYDAFKKAQKTVRERGFKSPYYWASFILLDGK
jgi:CHAT domain-containing protein